MLIKRLTLVALLTSTFSVCSASSYATQLASLERNPHSTLALSQELEDPEGREILYQCGSQGGLLVDVYKGMSKEYSRHTLWHLSPKEMPGLYDALHHALPPSLKVDSQFFIFLSDQPIGEYAWTHRYTSTAKKRTTQCTGIPISRDAFETLSERSLEQLVIIRALLGVATHQIATVLAAGRSRRDTHAKAIGGSVGLVTLITTLWVIIRFVGHQNFRVFTILLDLFSIVSKLGRDAQKAVSAAIAAPAVATSYLTGKGVFDLHNSFIKKRIQGIFDEYLLSKKSGDGLQEGYIAYHTAAHAHRASSHQNTLRLINAARQYFTAQEKREPAFLHDQHNLLLEEQKEDGKRAEFFKTLTHRKAVQLLNKEVLQKPLAILRKDADNVMTMEFF